MKIEWRIKLSATGYTAVIRQDGPWWIGWIEEIPGVNCQGETREELIANLREALSEAIELNREDAKSAAGESFEEIAILLDRNPDPNARNLTAVQRAYR